MQNIKNPVGQDLKKLCGVIFMKKTKRSFLAKVSLVLIFISLLGMLSVAAAYIYVSKNIDYSADEVLFSSNKGSGATAFYYDKTNGEASYEPALLSIYKGAGVKKQWKSYENIGDNLKSAFIATEDRDFFKHRGVDFKRTALAFLNSFIHFKPKFGASTITQQVIKNISGDREQTFSRKLSEIFRAIHLENVHTKEEIFEVYMNIAPMGDGILGVGMASEYYFGKEPSELSYGEAATLVGITNAPAIYNPRINPDKSLKKRNNVLYAMLDFGVITEEEYNESVSRDMLLADYQPGDTSVDSWFIETLLSDLTTDLSARRGMSENAARVLIMNGGLSVYTTANPEIQKTLEEYFENQNNFPEAVKLGLNYSMVVADSKNGNLLGIVGGVGRKNGNRLLNHATVPHTPGSALKPIALYAPLINEKRVNWATTFDDVPVYFNEDKNGNYTPYPKNYPAVYDGLITLDNALRVSKNTVAVRLYELLGKEKIFNSLKVDFGFSSLVDGEKDKNGRKLTDKALAPLALGQMTYGVTLRDLTQAYTVFPSDGVLSHSRSYTKVFDSEGRLLLENEPQTKRIYTKECARIMNRLLMRVTDSGTAKIITLGDVVDTAGKTGTSGNDIDRLFIGYTPYYTAGIWCGYNKNSQSVGAQSISHLEIWDGVMNKIHNQLFKNEDYIEGFSVGGLEYLPYCKDSGELYSENCLLDPRSSRLEYGYFTADNKPSKKCDRHVICYYDSVTGGVAADGCPDENLIEIALLDISDRSFPTEVVVVDAEYVWRRLEKGDRLGDTFDVPYFVYTLDEGEFVGRGKKKKQYNSSCYIHGD